MTPAQQRALITAACTIGGGLLVLALLVPDEATGEPWFHVVVGLVVGTIFGQTTLAAAWNALGPLPLLWRLPLSLAWLVSLAGVFCIRLSLEAPSGGEVGGFFLILASALLAQWLLVQLPFWWLVLVSRWQLGVQAATPAAHELRQYGIRELMMLTAVVAVLLGGGRAVFLYLVPQFEHSPSDVITTAFLAFATVLSTLPLVIAALLPKRAIVACLIIITLIAASTLGEAWAFYQLTPLGGLEAVDFCWINAFTVAWICLPIWGIRASGYGLATRQADQTA